VREKEFVWGSKQIGQNYMFKVKESDQVKLATIRIRFGLRLQYAGKMTMRDAQLIEKLFFGRYSIAYLTRGTMKS